MTNSNRYEALAAAPDAGVMNVLVFQLYALQRCAQAGCVQVIVGMWR